jgi:hypothetical protein
MQAADDQKHNNCDNWRYGFFVKLNFFAHIYTPTLHLLREIYHNLIYNDSNNQNLGVIHERLKTGKSTIYMGLDNRYRGALRVILICPDSGGVGAGK